MKFIRFVIATLVVAMACLALDLGWKTPIARAQAFPSRPVAQPVATAASKGTVTIIVLDMSGSMGQNDPDGIRCSAAKAYIDLSGAGDQIGIVGLDNNNGVTGGSHNFQLAQTWSNPVDMSTIGARNGLDTLIDQKSNNCRPDASTPTYDALSKALDMLTQATQGGQSGSVILLTDGIPDPDTAPQTDAIDSELVPQFKQHGWPVDTIALGQNLGGFHAFLSGIANATSGSFNDDGNGDAGAGTISPLNITPFFIQIFARRHPGITETRDFAPTTLQSGQGFAQNFNVADYVDILDVIVTKDNAGVTASLKTPNNQIINSPSSGIVVSTDPHYAIYIIELPQSGLWELDVSGAGQFEMYSATTSSVGVAITAPIKTTAVQALGSPIQVTANLTYQGQPITDDRFDVKGVITYSGGAGQYQSSFALDDKQQRGTFAAAIMVPLLTAPAGSYNIVVSAYGPSGTVAIASDTTSVRVELFPAPLLFKSQGLNVMTDDPTTDPVSASVIQWDPGLQAIYSIPWGPVQWLGGMALKHAPARPLANLRGRVFLGGTPYSQATVSGTATNEATHKAVTIAFINDGDGYFHAQFVVPASGTYLITFTTTGSFQDSHGDLTTVTREVQLSVQPATRDLEIAAWLVTLAFVLFWLFWIFFANNRIQPKPRGMWSQIDESDASEGTGDMSKVRHRGPLQSFFKPNVVFSRQVGLPEGLRIRFRWGGTMQIRSFGLHGGFWRKNDGSWDGAPISPIAVITTQLDYHQGQDKVRYEIGTRQVDDGWNSGSSNQYDAYGQQSGSSRWSDPNDDPGSKKKRNTRKRNEAQNEQSASSGSEDWRQ